MKLQGAAIAGFVKRPDPRARAILVFGPDSGLVRERANILGRGVVADLNDPFRVADLTGKSIADDPARLSDEAAAMSLTGGRRLVRVREAEDSVAAAFSAFFKDPPPGDSLVIVESGDLATRSKLRAAFEAAEIGVAVPCYVEDERSLERIVDDLLRERGIKADPEVASFLARRLVGDRMVARSEVEKLSLMILGRDRLTIEDVEAGVGDASAQDPDEPGLAAADGDFAGLDRALGRLYGDDVSPVAILRTAQRHFQRLRTVAAMMGEGGSAESVIERLRPPVYFKLKGRLARQARKWPVPALNRALERLVEAEADVKRTGIPDRAVCARALFQIASTAAARR